MQVQITAVVEVPDGTPAEAIEEWVKFELGAKGSLSMNNPLSTESLRCTRVDVETRMETEAL